MKPNITKMEREKDINGLINALKHEDVFIRRNAAVALGKIGDKNALKPLQTLLWDRDTLARGNAQQAINKISDRSPKQIDIQSKVHKKRFNAQDQGSNWWSKQREETQFFIGFGVLLGIFLVILSISGIFSNGIAETDTVSSGHVYSNNDTNSNVSSNDNNSISDNSSDSSSNSVSDNPGEDQDRGYDSGYQDGVNDAYYDSGYYDGLSKTMDISDMYRYGYKQGYKQGYNAITKNGPLERPQLSWDVYMDPRTGETIQ